MRRHSLKYVKKYFEEHGCELLEKEYKNARYKMKYKCFCGDVSEISFDNFKRGRRCYKCRNKKIANSKRFSFKDVKKHFEEQGCELLEIEYIDCKTKMKYKCKCGNINKISFDCFKRGMRCRECGGTKKLTDEYIKQYFKDHGCELLEKNYINCDTKMRYRCECGEINKITFYHFKNGQRCKRCSIKKRTGKNNCNYNPNLTDEDRNDRRITQEYRDWRRSIYEKHNYTCQKCSQRGGRLNAHHIEGYAKNKELRTDIDNGITFCQKCHKEFHKIYGTKNSNTKQLDKFLKL